jgi:anthranilate/para-aminobenzoate synthase component II
VLRITAETSDGLVMGLRHRDLDVEGVQFHPESILTGVGMKLLGTFLARCETTSRSSSDASSDPLEPSAES